MYFFINLRYGHSTVMKGDIHLTDGHSLTRRISMELSVDSVSRVAFRIRILFSIFHATYGKLIIINRSLVITTPIKKKMTFN